MSRESACELLKKFMILFDSFSWGSGNLELGFAWRSAQFSKVALKSPCPRAHYHDVVKFKGPGLFVNPYCLYFTSVISHRLLPTKDKSQSILWFGDNRILSFDQVCSSVKPNEGVLNSFMSVVKKNPYFANSHERTIKYRNVADE